MNRILLGIAIGLVIGLTILKAQSIGGYTTQGSTWLINSLVDNTAIGSNTPASGSFTSLSFTSSSTIQYGAGGGCTTGGGSYNTCSATVSWNAGFSSTSYYAVCNIISPTGYPSIMGITKSNTFVTVSITNGTANGATASGGSLNCIAVGL